MLVLLQVPRSDIPVPVKLETEKYLSTKKTRSKITRTTPTTYKLLDRDARGKNKQREQKHAVSAVEF